MAQCQDASTPGGLAEESGRPTGRCVSPIIHEEVPAATPIISDPTVEEVIRNVSSATSETTAMKRRACSLVTPARHPSVRSPAPAALFKYRSTLMSRSSMLSSEQTLETNLHYPLRERLRRLSRSQRKELLVRGHGTQEKVPPEPSNDHGAEEDKQGEDDASDVEDEVRITISKQSIVDHPMSSMQTDHPSEDEGPVIMATPFRLNEIKLHIYDLIANDTLMQLPWGCVCEIGKCFNEVNSALHELGTGAYHVGIEVNGIEYAYGATNNPGRTGIFSCIPKHSPGYQYRTTIDFGKRPLLKKTWVQIDTISGTRSTSFRQKIEYVDGRQVIKEMASEYMGIDYNILRRNCCTFARDACVRLGIPAREVPSWFHNLAESGAMTQDLARSTIYPITSVLSLADEADDDSILDDSDETKEEEDGFEVVPQQPFPGTNDLLVVMAPAGARSDLYTTNDIMGNRTMARVH